MKRAGGTRVMTLALAMTLAAWASAREPEPVSGAVADDRVTAFLTEHGLDEVLAAMYRRKLTEGTPDSKRDAAEALGKIYGRQLAAINDPVKRQELEERCRELLHLMPDVEGFELRVNLAKTTYLKAEEIAERDRLRLADDKERAEAVRILEQVAPAFKDIAMKVHRRHESLDRQLDQTPDEKADALREQVADLRRLRSLSRYYAGWSDLYIATLTGKTGSADSSLVQFGWLLNAPEGKPPFLDRLPVTLLKYEHVARSAMGVAMALAIKGSWQESVRWLDTVQYAPEVSGAVVDQIFVRKLGVLAGAGQWTQLETALREKQAKAPDPRTFLTPVAARYVVVLAMEYLSKNQGQDMLAQAARNAASQAMGELVARGDLPQVLSLAKRYGATILGEKGFIPAYVRAVQIYDQAREKHKAASGDMAEEPATDAETVKLYATAAEQFGKAAAEPDSGKYAGALSRSRVLEGLCRYYASEFSAAADRFEDVARSDVAEDVKRDSLWYAVLSLERAVERGKKDLADRRDKASLLYITTYPTSENSARLLVRRSGSGLMTEEKAVEILMAVQPGSPVYPLARRQAAKLLYQVYRRAAGKQRDAAALRFAGVAEEVLAAESARSLADVSTAAAKEAAGTAVLYARQIADAVLAMTAPDITRAENALVTLEKIALVHQIDTKAFDGEIGYRRLQIAIARGDEAETKKWIDRLGGESGEYPKAAARLVFRRAFETWQATGRASLAPMVVEHGRKVIAQMERDGTKLPDPALASVYDAAASAAASLGVTDAGMREAALTLDRAMLAAKVKTEAVLKRVARMSEAAGDDAAAVASWRELVGALEAGTGAWAEARYESLRIEAKTDPAAAAEALKQHQALYPSWGPQPWGAKLEELAKQVGGGG